eukprot:403346866
MDIAKVIKIGDFIKVLEYYKEYVNDSKALNSTKSELRNKLESYLNKRLIKLNKAAQKNAQKLVKILDFIMLLDRDLPYQDFFTNIDGLEVFPTIFKLTFYGQEYAVTNHVFNSNDLERKQENEQMQDVGEEAKLSQEYMSLSILQHEIVKDKVENEITHIEQKINFVINNLLTKMLYHCDKQKLLMQAAEVLYSSEKLVSTQKVAKLLVYFGKLFMLVDYQRCKYLQGSLFALGGVLKLEAKSYLHTKLLRCENNSSEEFKLVCPLFNEENEYEKQEKQRVRELSDFDLHYFENDFIMVVLEFVRNLAVPSHGAINNQIYDYYVEFSQEKFIDEYEEHEAKNPQRLYAIESAHYAINFLFDLLQFTFQYMVLTKENQSHQQDQSDLDKKNFTEQQLRSRIFDHRKEINASELLSIDYSFYFRGFDRVLTEVCQQIKNICPNQELLLWFWHTKCAEADSDKNWADVLEEARDSYDRQDNYNVFGLSVYYCLSFKQSIDRLTGNNSTHYDFCKVNQYQSPFANAFMFDCLMPLFRYCIKSSKSETIINIGLESVCYWAYLNQTTKPIYEYLGQFTKDEQSVQYLVQQIYNFMGNGQYSDTQGKLFMKVVYQIINMYSVDAQIRIFNYIFNVLDDEKNDRAISILISQFYKNFMISQGDEAFIKYLQNTKEELFDLTLDCMKDDSVYILDLTERIQASLNLYWFIVMREKNMIKEGKMDQPVITESAYYNETLRRKYFEAMAQTIQAGLSGLVDDEKKVKENGQEQEAQKAMMKNVEAKRNSLYNLQSLLSQVSSLQ